MFTPVTFEPEIEERVRFVEETDPEKMVEATLARLRSGTTPLELLTADCLAITRSTELPAEHHGGPIHPICAVHAVHEAGRRLPGELAWLPIIQHAVLCNNHVHSPTMGPYVMPEIEPLEAGASKGWSHHINDEALHSTPPPAPAPELDARTATKQAFRHSAAARQPSAAEHHFLWLLERLSPGEAFDQLLPVALERNHLDDHNFLYPAFTATALDRIGWQWGRVLFRPVVRYQARQPLPLRESSPVEVGDVASLVDEYRLLSVERPAHTSAAETQTIGALGEQLGASRDYGANALLIARALADGLSLEGAGEAVSIGVGLAYLSTSYGNPMDSHLHTGTYARRSLLRRDGVELRNRIHGLLTAFTGPEVLLPDAMLDWASNVEAGITSGLPQRSQAELLDALTESIESQPWLDWRSVGVENVVAPDDVKRSIALARQYADLEYSAEAYFERLAEIACRDDFTEMHALKHFQAIVDEYHATRAPYRWVHLVAAAKSAAVTHVGREHRVYREARAQLAA
jgi:hypothetical protein